MSGRNEAEINKLEEERLTRTVQNKHGLGGGLIKQQAPAEETTGKANQDIHFTIEGLPAEPNAPVEILINGEVVYNSGSVNEDVSAKIVAPINRGWGNLIKVTLKIPVMGFENTKQFSLNDGFFIKFGAGPKGLAINQQHKPF